MAPVVRVGVGVFVLYSSRESSINPRFLMGKRLNSHGSGTYALPGGHLEFGETLEECAAREVLEETGLEISDAKFLTATNDYMPAEEKHYVTIFMVCVRKSEEQVARVLEPHKCQSWGWFDWEGLKSALDAQNNAQDGDSLERPIFLPLLNLLRQRPGTIPAVASAAG